MSEQKLSSQVRRQQLARAALQVIAAGGLRRLSMARLAHQVGLAPSAIYRHFRGKEDLLEAALESARQRLLDNVARVCSQTPDALERLEKLLALHVGMIRENVAIPRLVFSEDVYGGRARRREYVRDLLQGYLKALADIIRQGQADGQIRKDLDPATAALLFFGLFQPAGILWHLSDGNFNVTGHARRAWRIFSQAIRARQT